MAMTCAEKILAAKASKDRVVPGEIVIVPVDCAMMTDILGPRIFGRGAGASGPAYLGPGAGCRGVRPLYALRHGAPSGDRPFHPEWAAQHDVRHCYELEGPCHQLLAERGFSRPGSILVGTDSHSCTSGAFGCFGTGIGSTEMLGVLIRGEIWFKVPESIRIT